MTSTVNITIDSSTMDHETFTCHVSFPNPSAVDQRAPSYHDSCSVDMSVVRKYTIGGTQSQTYDSKVLLRRSTASQDMCHYISKTSVKRQTMFKLRDQHTSNKIDN